MLFDFANTGMVMIAESWFQMPYIHHWICSPIDSNDSEYLWSDFYTQILKVSEICCKTDLNRPEASKDGGDPEHYRGESQDYVGSRTGHHQELKRICEICGLVLSQLWTNDPRSTYRGIWTQCSFMDPPRCFTVEAADDRC